MEKTLRKTYLTLLLPVIAGFIFVYLGRVSHLLDSPRTAFMPLLASAIFIVAAVCAVAVPVFMRALFAHRLREAHRASAEQLLTLERNILRVALVAPYMGLAGFFFAIPKFHLAGTFLAALYALYYHYPSRRRIAFDKRIFRVTEASSPQSRSKRQ
jgi:hypothetical protein